MVEIDDAKEAERERQVVTLIDKVVAVGWAVSGQGSRWFSNPGTDLAGHPSGALSNLGEKGVGWLFGNASMLLMLTS